jgi:hypothetical protein
MIMKKITFLLTTILFVFSGIVYSQNGDETTIETIDGIEYKIHKYTTTSANIFTPPVGVTRVDVLVVAGGGGGAGNTAYSGAGGGAGGAGGLIFKEGYTVTPGSAISLNVGVGGNGRNGLNTPADNGEATLFDGLTALGGGGGNITPGGETTNSPAADGGSGGGGRLNPAGSGLQEGSTDGGFGNDGARNSTDNGGGGGGGAGTQPSNITGNDGGDGGDGLDYSAFFGPSVGDAGFFAGGGGGGGDNVGAQGLGGQGGGGDGSSAIPGNLIAPSTGMANTGGGGGGGSVHAGAAGGSGTVIIRYINFDASDRVFNTSGNWDMASNWFNGLLPDATNNDVIIIADPNIATNNNTSIGNLISPSYVTINIEDGISINAIGNLNHAGQFTGDGEVTLNGTAAQTISGGGSFENLRLDNPTPVDITDPADLFGVVYVDQGTLNTNGNLTLRCNFGTPGKTAQVAPVLGTINGDVTVEQCYPARRAFRFLSPSVTTATSIRENWQENPVGYLDNPRLGYGTHITGVSPGAANATLDQDGDNGFDYNPSGNASMFTYDNIAQDWNPVANTTDNLIAGTPYRLMIRGDRSINIEQNNTSPTNTRLSATGTLIVGSYTPTTLLFTNVDNDFNFIANPYHAQVDIRELINNSLNLKDMEYYVWDPTLNTRGGYATVDLNTNNSPAGDANVYLQPMQAAFVRTGASGSAPVVNFE